MNLRISGIVLALMGMTSGVARGGVQITGSTADLSVTAIGSSFVGPCTDQVHVATLGDTELTCVSVTPTGRAETILSLFTSSTSNNRHITMRLLNDSQASTSDPSPFHVNQAGGSGRVNLGFAVTDEPMEVTVTIAEFAAQGSFTEMRASWSVGASGSITSEAGQVTQSGVLTGIIEPGGSGAVSLDLFSAWASHGDSAFAHMELTIDFRPTVCSAPETTAAAAEDIFWNNPVGGSYSVAGNWDPTHVPTGDCQEGDTAIFDLATSPTISINADDATAGRWRFLDGTYQITGLAELFSSSVSEPSLKVAGADVTLTGIDLYSVDAAIGPGSLQSKMVVTNPQTVWENEGLISVGKGELNADLGGSIFTDDLRIGSVVGSSAVVRSRGVSGGEESSIKATGTLTIGGSGSGTLEVLDGAVLQANEIEIGKSGDDGSVLVKGSSNSNDPLNTDDFALIFADTSLAVGGPVQGTVTIEKGGGAQAKSVHIDTTNGSKGLVIVDGQGGLAVLNVLDTLTIGASDLVELEAKNGGLIQAQSITIGNNQSRPGAADLTIRGSATEQDPERRSKIRVLDHPRALGPAGVTLVGASAPGQLNVLEGGQASLEGGLQVGGAAQGIVVVSAPGISGSLLRSKLSVTGQTNVGHIQAPGILSIGPKSDMDATGDLRIGLGGGNPNGTVVVSDGCNVTVHGTLAVGVNGPGLIDGSSAQGGLGHSFVQCDTLLVGGNIAAATGRVDVNIVHEIEVSGNAQVGVGPGAGVLFLDTAASFLIGGTLTIGNPGGGPGGGTVILVEADIGGAGNIVVNPNGSLLGTGTISVTKVNAGGQISPGLSPGTLTINGDYELLETGSQIIEYAGLNPGEFDRLVVTGAATLGGRLEIHFRNGFSLPDPNAFIHSQEFLESDQEITGDYAERIYAFPDLFADFDDDGDKDLKDVRAFQNCYGRSGAQLQPACGRADWEGNGLLNEVDVRELTSRLTGPD